MQRIVFLLGVVVAALLFGAVFLMRGGAPEAAAVEEGVPKDPLAEAHIVLGRGDAPGYVVEFSNYACPHCREHAERVLMRLVNDYVATGKVRYVFRHLPFEGQEDVFWASVAAGCVYDQAPARFFDYHLLLFRAGPDWQGRGGEAVKARLLDYARQLSLSVEALRNCLASEQAKERVRFDQRLARALGVTGTPTFFVGGKKYEGFMPYERWREILAP